MTQEYSKAIQDLLDWNICEKNSDEELKPTSDFLVWYYDHLIHMITECYGSEWEDTIDSDNITDEQSKQMDERDKEKEELIKDCIQNQIVMWTAQRMPDGRTVVELDVDEHVNIIHRLINEIDERLMHTQTLKLSGSGPNPDANSSLDDMLKEMRGRKEADLKRKEEAELERKKEAEKQQKKMGEYID
jgi:hypothetical protein